MSEIPHLLAEYRRLVEGVQAVGGFEEPLNRISLLQLLRRLCALVTLAFIALLVLHLGLPF